ncbi:hypothetical protein AYI92_06400 [Shewanella xiamenensis]|uniref:restriction endonuclease subunit S n=1 Tax=Shewanella xiamenensis TaxID=332186 RepID=UPI001186358F|nr:restriction endonuclease subunit S [Shewanella xiamenensis]TVL21124.1 hypothetical protein AYI90_06780 [Shewanella xiamenensis]TVL21383.1 hypothetical protein AYI91_08090 [Shewanella xiamenensis]TVL27332.1 hypothetical protein AYI92_06400 [Shewanella xiamenensis]TVL34879.1 hypothetical protein AYI93_07015 [Shewanella xiamenensis]TVP03525.1 hypothetical protein AYI89_07000 [Shewanella xiamenensis]
MIANYTNYPVIKDSHIPWVGNIPSSWQLKKVKFLFSIRKRIAGCLGYDVLSVTQRGIVKKDIDSGEGQLSTNYSKYQIVHPGDFAMNHMDLLTGYVDISQFEGVTSPDYRVFILNDLHNCSKYFLYIFQLGYQLKIFFHMGQGASHFGRWRLATEEFKEMEFPLPSYSEQHKIAAFLDYETVRIDQLIAKQQRLIELLKEKRQAVISHAVTKGLNPNAPMKDSGIEWLGQVPEHWGVTYNKYLVQLTPKKSQIALDREQLCSFIPMEKLKQDTLILDEQRVIGDVFDGYTYFEDEDILLAKVTPCFENKNSVVARGLINGVGFGSTEIFVLRCNSQINNDFMYYRLQEGCFMDTAIAAMTGAGGLKRVPSDVIANYKIALPPYKEQLDIVKTLKHKLDTYDTLVANAISAIELMQERRTAIISAAVTGKIDLRNWEQPNA